MNLLFLLRRNATEESAGIVQFWEWIQTGVATAFFFMILLGDRPLRSALMLIPSMLSMVLLQRLVLTPHLTSLGRDVDEIAAVDVMKNPTIAAFQLFRAFYLSSEGVKLLLGIGLLSRLMVRHDRARRSATEPGPEPAAVIAHRISHRGSHRSGVRRRTTDRNG